MLLLWQPGVCGSVGGLLYKRFVLFFFEFYEVFMIGFIFMFLFMELRCLKVKKGCVKTSFGLMFSNKFVVQNIDLQGFKNLEGLETGN